MLCVLCAPCCLAQFYWNEREREKEKNAKAEREGLWTFIKWPTRLQTCHPEAQNWVNCLMWGLQTCADSWPSVNNAAVSRTWPGSPHTLSFPWDLDESTPNTRCCLCSPHWNVHLALRRNHQLSFVSFENFSSTVQDRRPYTLNLVPNFVLDYANDGHSPTAG